jgi:glutamate mutase epsilon subunit
LQQLFAKMLTRFEVRDFLGRHVDLFTRLRIATSAFTSLSDAKRTESAKLDLFVAVKSGNDALENDLDDLIRLLSSHIGFIGNKLNQISLGHCHA